VTNADTLGVRPDLTGRPITSWADLISPDFKGKSALQDNPTIGVIDVAMAVEARGDLRYLNKGNMTRDEIDKTIALMSDIKKSGTVPLVLDFIRPVGEPDGLRRGRHPVDVVARRHCGEDARHPLRVPAAEGGLPRLGLHLRHNEASERAQARLRARIRKLVRLRVSGSVHRPPGLLFGPARESPPSRVLPAFSPPLDGSTMSVAAGCRRTSQSHSASVKTFCWSLGRIVALAGDERSLKPGAVPVCVFERASRA